MSRKTFDAALDGVTLDWDLPELAPPGAPPPPHTTEDQAEFRSPGAYFDQKSLNGQVATGRQLLAKYDSDLDAIEERYGVPRGIVVAIWARESSFGRAAIPKSAIRTLATHAFMSRRKEFFRPELIAALQNPSGRRHFGCKDEELMGRGARPAAVPAVLLPQIRRRRRRRW